MKKRFFMTIDFSGNVYIDDLKLGIKNLTKKECFDLLNEQDEKIKELESKLRVNNSQLANYELEHRKLKDDYAKQEKLLSQKLASNSNLHLENQQLKQSQNSKAIEVLEQLRKKFEPLDDIAYYLGYEVVEKIDNQIVKLEGVEDETSI